MLVLARKLGEEIVIGNDIRVVVVAVQGEKVRPDVVLFPDANRAKLEGQA